MADEQSDLQLTLPKLTLSSRPQEYQVRWTRGTFVRKPPDYRGGDTCNMLDCHGKNLRIARTTIGLPVAGPFDQLIPPAHLNPNTHPYRVETLRLKGKYSKTKLRYLRTGIPHYPDFFLPFLVPGTSTFSIELRIEVKLDRHGRIVCSQFAWEVRDCFPHRLENAIMLGHGR